MTKMEDNGTKYGWYSQIQAESIGYALYEKEDGTEVKITEVTRTEVASPFFRDVKAVGKVIKFKSSYFTKLQQQLK